jgi:hypothetical protein
VRSDAGSTFDGLGEEHRVNSRTEVRHNNGYKGLFAKEDIIVDSVVLYMKGTLSTNPTRYTIQLGRNRHLGFPLDRKTGDDLDYRWQYLNHSCEPSAYVSIPDLTVRAAGNIRREDAITFNYLTTECDMAEPFACICESAYCFGFIQGRDFLNADQARRLSLGAW